ncbi:MAG: nucleotide pyrophosphohydrolase [Candidatus Hermodarchaeota archaeon]
MNSSENDKNTFISYFKKKVKNFVRERNWSNYHTPKNLIQALGIEIAELSELFLFKEYSVNEILKNKSLFESISDELADILIYLISLVNCLRIDLTKSFNKKMEKNERKYPIKEFNNGKYYKK